MKFIGCFSANIHLSSMVAGDNVYRVDIPAYAYGFIIVGVDGNGTAKASETFTMSDLAEGATYKLSDNTVKPAASVDGVEYDTLQAAINAANGGTVTVLENVTLNESIVIDGDNVTKVTLDLAGHTINAVADAEIVEVLLVKNGAEVTVTGNGTMLATGDGEHVEVISVIDGASVTIENGTFVSDGCTAIYATRGGNVTIKGGYYEAKEPYQGKNYLIDINELEESGNFGSIKISGGQFVNFDPANHNNDGASNSNKLETGYHSIKEGDVYVVSAHSYNAEVIEPTCTVGGYTIYTCACGDTYRANETEATGHTNSAPVVGNKVDATCTTTGSYDSVVYCTVCGTEISRETVTVTVKEHVFDGDKCECGAIRRIQLVTNASDLVLGDQIVIVEKDCGFALSTTQKDNNRGGVKITKNDDGTLTIGSDVQIIVLEAGALEGTFAFYVETGYLYAANNNTKTENGYSYTSNQVMLQSGTMQWQRSNGYITVATNDFVKLEMKSTAGTFTVTVGGKTVTGTTSNGVTTYDLTGLTGEIKISVGSVLGKVEYIKFYK